ncbi:threonine-phosphate decarboxylase CobD [Albirhodobacter sp. R86504]|uniref:threonine-phosphate decarboxylase CobD n=1 Tax=Albirhodobacter sp. R86504 TaxID=3093848 RepID=UPI00366EF0C3
MRDHGGNLDAARLRYGGSDWIDLSTGINRAPYPLPSISHEAWASLPQRTQVVRLCEQARATYAVAEQADILPVAGAQAAIQMLPHVLPRGRAHIYGPTYNEHSAALSAAGWDVRTVTSLSDVEGADLGVIVNPNNPSGEVFQPETLLALRANVGALIVDESFADPQPDLSLAPYAGEAGLLILRSFGKFYGLAGLRLGFIIGAPDQVAALRDMAGPWPVCGPALEIGRTALGDRDWAKVTIARLREECGVIDAIARQAGWTMIGGCELFRLYSCENAQAAQDKLARASIWSRIFPWSDELIRLGLPSGDVEWGRLRAAMEG